MYHFMTISFNIIIIFYFQENKRLKYIYRILKYNICSNWHLAMLKVKLLTKCVIVAVRERESTLRENRECRSYELRKSDFLKQMYIHTTDIKIVSCVCIFQLLSLTKIARKGCFRIERDERTMKLTHT